MLLNKINENKKTLQQLNKKPRKQTNRYSMEILLFSKVDIQYGLVYLQKDFLNYKAGSYPIDTFIEILKTKKI